MHRAQPNWSRVALFVILGLVAGGALGMALSRAIASPLRSATWADMPAQAREDYVMLVAAAYSIDGDLDQAHTRLERLDAPNVGQWIAPLVDRHLAEEPDTADTRALVTLAHGLGLNSRQVLTYLAALTPRPTDTPPPTPTQTATMAPSPTLPPTEAPATTPPSPTIAPPPTDTPAPEPSAIIEASPTDTSIPQPTNTPRPALSATPRPTNTPAAKWSWTARLVGPGQEGQSCAEGHKLIRVTVLDAAGNQIPGVWVHEKYTGWYRVTGHKGDDPYWGPGEVELNNLDGGQVCIAIGDGGACESEFTRNLSCHDAPPFEDLWAAGYCDCREEGLTKDECRELYESGQWLAISHYYWRVEFKRAW